MMRTRFVALAGAVAILALAGMAAAEVVGKTTGPLIGKTARLAECSLGDLVADAVRAQAGAEVALVPASQLRQRDLPAGDLTADALTDSLVSPDEQVAIVSMDGKTLRSAIEFALTMAPDKPNPAFLQVSGISVTFRSDRPQNQRVGEVQVGASPLVAERQYRVAMPASLAKGALGYFRLFDGLERKQTGGTLGAALVDYVAKQRTVTPQSGRLSDLAPPAQKQ
ncbi:MAG: 5'-nucleotidase C-terminal domain-containing protein [Armatimonadota bacterium]